MSFGLQNRKVYFWLVFGLIAILAGCTSINVARKRNFVVNAVWVRTALSEPNLGFRKISRFQPLVFQNQKKEKVVIVGNGVDGIGAYDAFSGAEKWKFRITNGVEAPGVLVDHFVFFGANDGNFYSLDAETGTLLWSFPSRSENLSEPLFAQGILYFMSGTGNVYALEAETGKQKWIYTRNDTATLSIRGGSKPALKGDSLFLGTRDGSMIALSAATGIIKWEKSLSANKRFPDLDTDPLVDNDTVYAVGFEDKLYALKTADGDIRWKYNTGGFGPVLRRGPNDLIYTSTSETVIDLNEQTFKPRWEFSVKTGIASPPILSKGLAIFGESEGFVRFLDAVTGKLLGSYEPGSSVLSQPGVDEETESFYVISSEANIYCLHADWKFAEAFPYLP